MQLYEHQQHVFDETIESLKTFKRICISAPTGSGKTVLSKFLIEHFITENKNVAFIVNRTELIKQTIRTFGGNKVSVLKAGFEKHYDENKPIQIIMLQTWYARKDRIKLPFIDIILFDEFHLMTDDGLMASAFIDAYPDSKIIGLTATPITADGYKLDNYDKLIDLYRTRDLQKLGFLVQDRWFSSQNKLELDDVDIVNGDYVEKQLSYIMKKNINIQNVLENYKKHAEGKKTVIFAVSIAHAEALYKQFKIENYSVAILHSLIDNLDKERNIILDKFKTGEIKILINVLILTTGFDEPSVECIILARPTKSLRLFLQCVGRSLRICNGKSEALILDCANNVWEHGLATDDFDFTLPRINKAKKKKQYIKLCPMCESANPQYRDTCINCDFNFEKNKREFSYKIINEEIKEIVIDDISIHERGLSDLKHIFELLITAKLRNPATAYLSNNVLKKFILGLYDKYITKFENDTEFFNFVQSNIIQIIRKKNKFWALKYKFIGHFQEENKELINQLMLIKGYHEKLCKCGGRFKLNRDLQARLKVEVYQCERCGVQYSAETLKRGVLCN